jgi:hypothetical protein
MNPVKVLKILIHSKEFDYLFMNSENASILINVGNRCSIYLLIRTMFHKKFPKTLINNIILKLMCFSHENPSTLLPLLTPLQIVKVYYLADLTLQLGHEFYC